MGYSKRLQVVSMNWCVNLHQNSSRDTPTTNGTAKTSDFKCWCPPANFEWSYFSVWDDRNTFPPSVKMGKNACVTCGIHEAWSPWLFRLPSVSELDRSGKNLVFQAQGRWEFPPYFKAYNNFKVFT